MTREEDQKYPGSMLDRLAKVEDKAEQTAQAAKSRKKRGGGRATADKLAVALLAARGDRAREQGDDLPLEDFRSELFAAIRKLIPKAIAQAEAGKPALLRILCRYTR